MNIRSLTGMGPPVLIAAAGLLVACGVPERILLPVPVPLTQGGTVVPANGGGFGFDFGDGLLGQELLRTEMISGGLLGGLGDRVGLALYSFGETRENDQGGTFARLKVRAGPLAGPESSVALALAYSTSSREEGDTQDERVTSIDVSVPVERLLAASSSRRQEVSGYLAPRIIFEKYEDRLDPAETLDARHPGLLVGLHGRSSNFHLFGELTFLHLSARVVRGERLDAAWMVIPSVGMALHFGPVHQWGR